MTTRHELLAELHVILKPDRYLEIGVQHGWSLDLASAAKVAVGIDPHPLVQVKGNQVIFSMTSDEYFAGVHDQMDVGPIDFAFIDGEHLWEFALRDFVNIEARSHSRSIVVFDDVFPLNQGMAARQICPGDWTGDVWKVAKVLQVHRKDLVTILVDTFPTGTMIVLNLDSTNTSLTYQMKTLESIYHAVDVVPDEVLNRAQAWTPQAALEAVREWTRAT